MYGRINIQEHILLWNSAAVKIKDVRHIRMSAGEELLSYRFPASGFIFTTLGSARMRMDGVEHTASRFYMLHGGKGACLDIALTDQEFSYYILFYKATILLPNSQEVMRLAEQYNPFQLQYGFVPRFPASLFDKVDKMLLEWHHPGRLEQFHTKTLFYQFVYELMRQLEHQQIDMHVPNLADQIIRYLQEHYNEPVSRESLAQIYHYSVPYLSRQFKLETGRSIIDYLIGIRIDHAKDLLLRTDMTLQEVAAGVGYADVSYFTRIFKKVAGVNPKQFRDMQHNGHSGFDRPVFWLGSSIVPRKLQRYIGNENHYRYRGERNGPMFRHRSFKGSTLLLCLTLLLSACSSTTNTNSGSGNSSLEANASSNQTAAANEQTQASANNGNTAGRTETVTYSAINGNIEIPKNPQRVVVVAGAYAGYFLALGLKPVGAAAEAFHNYTEGKMEGVENIGDGVSSEKILELQPDLIIIWNSPEDIEKLTKIAPTIAIDYGTPVREQMLEFGKMTGRVEQANAWIASWDQKIAQYKPLVESAVGDKTVSIFDSGSVKEFYAYGQNLGRGGDIIYGEFHLKAPPLIQKEAIDSGQGWAKLSLELLPDYAGDFIFISGWTGQENPEVVFDGSIWDSLPAVQNGRVFVENGRGFLFSDPISLEAQLEYVVDSLTKK